MNNSKYKRPAEKEVNSQTPKYNTRETEGYMEILAFVIEQAPRFSFKVTEGLPERVDIPSSLPLNVRTHNSEASVSEFNKFLETSIKAQASVDFEDQWNIKPNHTGDFAELARNIKEYKKSHPECNITTVSDLVDLYTNASLCGKMSRQLTNWDGPETKMISMPHILEVFTDAINLNIVDKEELREKGLLQKEYGHNPETNQPAALCQYISNKTKFSFNAAVIQERANKEIYPQHMQKFDVPYKISDVTETTIFMNGQS